MLIFRVEQLLVRKIETLMRQEKKIFKFTVADTENYCLHEFFIPEYSLTKPVKIGDCITVLCTFDNTAYLKNVEIVDIIKGA